MKTVIKIKKKTLTFIKNKIKYSNGGYIAINIFVALCGLIFIIFPQISVSTVSKITGLAFCIAGIMEIVVFFIRELQKKEKMSDFLSGVLFLVSGMAILLYPELPVFIIPFCLSVFCLIYSFSSAKRGFEMGKAGHKLCFIITVLCSLSTAASAVLIFCPYTHSRFMAVLLGFAFIIPSISKAVLRIIKMKNNR